MKTSPTLRVPREHASRAGRSWILRTKDPRADRERSRGLHGIAKPVTAALLVVVALSGDAAQVNHPGTVDDSFRPAAFTSEPFGFRSVTALAVQSDGKVIVGGDFTHVGNLRQPHLARLNADGSLDAGFRPAISKQDSFFAITQIVIDPDGRILVAGWYDSVNGYKRYGIARLNRDGTLDPTFAPKFESNSRIEGTTVLPNGRILFFGFAMRLEGRFMDHVVRTGTTGKLDSSFVFDSSLSGSIEGLLPLRSSKYLVWGFMRRWLPNSTPSQPNDRTMYRVLEGGGYDASFVGPFSGFERPEAVVEQDDGKLIVAGGFDHIGELTRYGCARLQPNGQLDPTFQVGGPDARPADHPLKGHSVLLQTDGKILLIGSFNDGRGTRLVRLMPNGAFDADFTPTLLDYVGRGISMVSAGDSIFLAGDFGRVNGIERSSVVRIRNGELRETPLLLEIPRNTPDGLRRVRFTAVPTHVYRILASVDLIEWDEAERITAATESVEWTDSRTPEFPHRFYKVHRVDSSLAHRP